MWCADKKNNTSLLYITVLYIILFNMKGLTKIQHQVYTFVSEQVKQQQPFPSLREIAAQFGFTHTTARFHLKALEKKGYIRQREQRLGDYLLQHTDQGKSEQRKNEYGEYEEHKQHPNNLGTEALNSFNPSGHTSSQAETAYCFELVASIPAGIPATAYEESPEFFSVDNDFFGGGEIKALRVKGESMTGDAISDGDIALIRLQNEANQRDIVAVRVDTEITLKRLRYNTERDEIRTEIVENTENVDSSNRAERVEDIDDIDDIESIERIGRVKRIELIPSNPDFAIRSVVADQVEILGRLVGIIRKTD